MSITYDRIAPEHFTAQLGKSGCFDPLVRFAREEPLLDLQFRSGSGTEPRITLYYGLTALLDVRGQTKAKESSPDDPVFEINPHKGQKATAKLPATLTGKRKASHLAEAWPEIERYLRSLMTEMNQRWTRGEGAVPSSLKATGLISVIDSEVVLRFSIDTERRGIKTEVSQNYLKALSRTPVNESWWKVPLSFGNELDILGVDEQGRVLLVELKQASATSGIAWAAAQVSVYRKLFERWIMQDPERAVRTLNDTLRQRRRLGLAGGGDWPIAAPLQLVPVIGIGGGEPSKEAIRRFHMVQDRLCQEGVGYDDLEVWQFGAVTRRNWRQLATSS